MPIAPKTTAIVNHTSKTSPRSLVHSSLSHRPSHPPTTSTTTKSPISQVSTTPTTTQHQLLAMSSTTFFASSSIAAVTAAPLPKKNFNALPADVLLKAIRGNKKSSIAQLAMFSKLSESVIKKELPALEKKNLVFREPGANPIRYSARVVEDPEAGTADVSRSSGSFGQEPSFSAWGNKGKNFDRGAPKTQEELALEYEVKIRADRVRDNIAHFPMIKFKTAEVAKDLDMSFDDVKQSLRLITGDDDKVWGTFYLTSFTMTTRGMFWILVDSVIEAKVNKALGEGAFMKMLEQGHAVSYITREAGIKTSSDDAPSAAKDVQKKKVMAPKESNNNKQ